MCVWVHRVDRRVGEAESDYADRVRALGPQPYPCRTCEECRKAYEGRLVGDFIAMKQTTQRCLVVLLTYNRRYLEAAGRPLEVLSDIDVAKEDARKFIPAFRKMLRRLHPELNVSVGAFRVTEIAPHVQEAAEDERLTAKEAASWNALSSTYYRRRKRPREGAPQAHHHLAMWFKVSWKDQARQEREPAQWSDDLIPHLRTDGYLYDHHWETKAEAKMRGGRIRKLATPWPWGFISYTDAMGGEGSYFAKYAIKCLKMRDDWKNNHAEPWSEAQLRDYQNAEKTMRSIRRSPRLGYDYYKSRAVLAAKQGLPPRLYFEFAEGAHCGEARYAYDSRLGEHVWKEGGPFKRTVWKTGERMVIGADGKMSLSSSWKRVAPSFLLQKVGRQRRYLSAYDRQWEALHGDREQPRGPVVRQKAVNGRVKQIVVYGLEEAREQIAKDDNRRFIAKRERYLARVRFAHGAREGEEEELTKRRRMAMRRLERLGSVPTVADVEMKFGTVAEELARDPKMSRERHLLGLRPVPAAAAGYNEYEAMSRGW